MKLNKIVINTENIYISAVPERAETTGVSSKLPGVSQHPEDLALLTEVSAPASHACSKPMHVELPEASALRIRYLGQQVPH